MQRLKENGITIEVPSYTMEMAEKLREAKNEESEFEESSCVAVMMKKRTSTVLWLKGLRILKESKFWREHITRYNLQSQEPQNA